MLLASASEANDTSAEVVCFKFSDDRAATESSGSSASSLLG